MVLVDFHCHLAEAGGYTALKRLASLFEAPPRVVAVTNRPADWRAMATTNLPEGVTWALGLHPAIPHEDHEVDEMMRLLPVVEVVGEVGLDYSARAGTPRGHQRRTLERILSSPHVRGRLVTIHSRSATADIVNALTDYLVPGAVLHWFLGNSTDIERAIDVDVYFSVNEAMLASERGGRVLDALPPNRVVLETDAPFGGALGKRNRPADFDRTIAGLAKRWVRSAEAVVSLVESNQEALLNRVTRPAAFYPGL